MALKDYNRKRQFDQTPEPTGGIPERNQLRFVIQKHDASRLHYDFRLEMDGVLKSWAVPKGPSLNPEDRRLAMMVEDHPYDYRKFEGIIPEGNYGAGTVIIWDEGTYQTLEPMNSKQEEEKSLLKQLKAGSLKFRLSGKKLKGEFALVHIKNNGSGDNAWLLIKHRDDFAEEDDVTRKDKSVVSGKSIEQMEKNKKAAQRKSNRPAQPAVKKKAVSAKKKTFVTPSKKQVKHPAAVKVKPNKISTSKKTGGKKTIPKKP